MIAFRSVEEPPPPAKELLRARTIAAAVLTGAPKASPMPRVVAWKAWLATAWLVLVSGLYLLSLLGWTL